MLRFPRPARASALFVAAAFTPFLVQAQSNPLQLDDIGKIVNVSDPQLSPDGKSIAMIVSRPNLVQDRYDASLVLVDVASGKQRILTYERKNVASPRWSPTGDRIAFLAVAAPSSDSMTDGVSQPNPPAGAKPAPPSKKPTEQIYVLPMNGGEAQPITRSAHEVEQIAWSPDGRQIAFAMADDNPSQKAIDRHEDAFEVGDNSYLTTEADVPAHLWLVSAEGGPGAACHFRELDPAACGPAEPALFAHLMVTRWEIDCDRAAENAGVWRFRPDGGRDRRRGDRGNSQAYRAFPRGGVPTLLSRWLPDRLHLLPGR